MVVEAVGRLDHHGRGQSRPGQASRSGGLVRESRRLYRRWEAEQPDDEPQATTDESETTLLAATTLEEAEEAARADLINYMAETPPYRFQDLVGKLLEAMGYHVVWIAPKGPDGGLDLAAQTDPLGVTGPRIKGQVKRRPDSKVTEDELRSFVSLIETDDVGVFISLGGFTREATRHGRETSRRVTLIDGERLLDLWVEHYGEDQTMWRPPLKNSDRLRSTPDRIRRTLLHVEAKGGTSSRPGSARFGKPMGGGEVRINIAEALYTASIAAMQTEGR